MTLGELASFVLLMKDTQLRRIIHLIDLMLHVAIRSAVSMFVANRQTGAALHHPISSIESFHKQMHVVKATCRFRCPSGVSTTTSRTSTAFAPNSSTTRRSRSVTPNARTKSDVSKGQTFPINLELSNIGVNSRNERIFLIDDIFGIGEVSL